MPEFCTCGAQLPPDAYFCHKCGKPQREIPGMETPAAEEAPIETPPVAPAPPAAPAVDFHNPVAVRIALLMATVSTVLIWIPFINFLVAGFGTTYFYRRRTGLTLNVASGARLGWITGVLMFVISAIVFSLQVLADGKVTQQMQAQLRALPTAGDPAMQQAMAFLQSPGGMALMLVSGLLLLFVCITGLSMAGGALGARLVGGNSGSRV